MINVHHIEFMVEMLSWKL